MEEKKLVGFYDYTVVLTYLGMIFAFMGIIDVLNDAFMDAIICLILAGICDMFDGAVASTKERNKQEKHFGIQIDSLCDLISFGVLPAIFIYVISGKNPYTGVLACAYTLCGLIRLAYYNVQEYERQQTTDSRREVYLGVPITTSAIILPFVYFLYSHIPGVDIWIFSMAMILLGTGFVTGIEIKKPYFMGKYFVQKERKIHYGD